jgi:hypothetical protein
MDQKQIDTMAEALRRQGLTWSQTNFAVSLVRNAVTTERERAARVCDDEARIREEAGKQHQEDSESRSRCFAAARAAQNCAKGVRNGEEV